VGGAPAARRPRVYHARVRIYTRTGDDGTTGLFGGARVPKDDPRVEAYGAVDELNAVIGLLRTEPLPPGADGELEAVQRALLAIGARLADPGGRQEAPGPDPGRLERWIDAMEEELPPLRAFVLPGGCRAAAVAHLARTVCRRAERRALAVAREDGRAAAVLPYLNRLSDALFVLARRTNREVGAGDVVWDAEGA